MTATYERSRELESVAAHTMKRWHKVLHQCGVTVAVLTVSDIDAQSGEISPCLKCNGYPAAATIAVTPIKQRALGVADALMVIDEATWDTLDEDEQIALLDHELTHLQVKAADKGLVGLTDEGDADRSAKLDDHRRPVLKLRKHDWQLGGFKSVARRHKMAAIEVQAVRQQLDDTTGQYSWDFGARSVAEIASNLRKLGVTQISSTIDGKKKTVDLQEGAVLQ